MKTPDEIKKGLACSMPGFDCCDGCPFDNKSTDGLVWECTVDADALAYIQQLESDNESKQKRIDELESRLAQVERERDAAVADINGMLETSDCEVRHVYCSRSTPPFECNADECKGYAKWRGVCEENTKEDET